MRFMSDPHLTRLESQLERLVEGAFLGLFGRKVRTIDLAIELVRTIENAVRSAGTSSVPLPDTYTIHLFPGVCQHLLGTHPDITALLAEYVSEVAQQRGLQLRHTPTVTLVPGDDLPTNGIRIDARHTVRRKHGTTDVLHRVQAAPTPPTPRNAHLLVEGERSLALTGEIINIGRGLDNDLVLDDRSVSRHHLQIRLRQGRYTAFDVQSKLGTRVNDVLIKEHTLHNGDVITLGRTRLVYLEDMPHSDGLTQSMDPVPSLPSE